MTGELPRFMKCQTCGNIINREKGCYLCPKPQQQHKREIMIGNDPWPKEESHKVIWHDVVIE